MSASLSEWAVILVIALLVIKPEHLPAFADRLGRLVRMVRRLIAEAKSEWHGK